MTVAVDIATRLAETPDLLRLRARRLLPDVCERYGCSRHTAGDAIRLARRWVAKVLAA